MTKLVHAWLAAALVLGVGPSWALDKLPSSPVLTVTGELSRPNDGHAASFDMKMLQALPQHDVVTSSPWFAGIRRFTGPLLRTVLSASGATGTRIRAIALDDYRAEIPASDAANFDVIVAHLVDGKPLSVRDKGPLFIVYPYDSKPELHSDIYLSRSVWHLHKLVIDK